MDNLHQRPNKMESHWPHSHRYHQSGGVSGLEGNTRRCTHSPGEEEGEKGCGSRVNILMDLTVLYPIATEHAAVEEEALCGIFSDLTKVRFWFNRYNQSLL